MSSPVCHGQSPCVVLPRGETYDGDKEGKYIYLHKIGMIMLMMRMIKKNLNKSRKNIKHLENVQKCQNLNFFQQIYKENKNILKECQSHNFAV